MDQGWITRTRRTFDRALQSLPITQHDRIWQLYLVRISCSTSAALCSAGCCLTSISKLFTYPGDMHELAIPVPETGGIAWIKSAEIKSHDTQSGALLRSLRSSSPGNPHHSQDSYNYTRTECKTWKALRAPTSQKGAASWIIDNA